MCENDIQKVCLIEAGIFSMPWKAEDFRQSMEKPENIYLVVEEDALILGYCGLWGVAGEGQITNVAVAKQHRGRGIAKSMLEKMLQLGRNQGLDAFTLEVRESNIPAIELYHKLGFHDAGIRKNFYDAPQENGLIMWL
jgi:ribosomal-protein-alanine N-acetyltransferase